MKRYIGFDLDGTLADTLDDVAAAVNAGLREIGCPPRRREEIERYQGGSVYELIRRAMAPKEDDGLLEAAKQGFDRYYAAHFCDRTRLFPGMKELCAGLAASGARLFLFSNKQAAFAREIVEQLLPDVPFAAVLGNCGEFPPKPDPEQLLDFQRREGFLAEECVLIGDSEVDVETARRAGIACAGVLWGYGERRVFLQAGADCYFWTAGDLGAWLRDGRTE